MYRRGIAEKEKRTQREEWDEREGSCRKGKEDTEWGMGGNGVETGGMLRKRETGHSGRNRRKRCLNRRGLA